MFKVSNALSVSRLRSPISKVESCMSKEFAQGSGSIGELSELEPEKVLRAAASLVSAYGEDAVRHARRLEAESAVPAVARRVRLEVERLMQASASAGDMNVSSADLTDSES